MSDDAAGALYESFLAGERPDDILVYLHEEGVGSIEALLEVGTRVENGVVLVLPAEEGKAAFESATGLDAMDFAGAAMDTDGAVDDDCTGGSCPEAGDGDDHHAKFVFAFAEAQNEAVGGLYAEGDVIHGYAACACGTTYSEKWVAEA